jgi:hypothetical protein
MEFQGVTVNISVPGVGGISGTWKPSQKEREAAWEMYVELVTRVAVVELRLEEGLLREALSSLYTIFGTTREILRRHGPEVAIAGEGEVSFGRLSVFILNAVLRPVLAKWHPMLLDYEKTRAESMSTLDHERSWDKYDELRDVLEQTRVHMNEYAEYLREVAGVPSLIVDRNEEDPV